MSSKVDLTPYQQEQLERFARGHYVSVRTRRVLCRLGLMSETMFGTGAQLTDDGRRQAGILDAKET